jgi:hypothetical protein
MGQVTDMVSSVRAGGAEGSQVQGRLCLFRSRSAVAALALGGLLMLVLILTDVAGLAQEGGRAIILESEKDAVAAASADDALARIYQTLATISDRNRDALQWVEGRLRQTAAEGGGPLLERWILTSRDEALREGTEPLPAPMKEMLLGFFPEALLHRVRYRIGAGSRATLQGYVFGVADTKGITLDDVIVFRDAESAADPLIWAHELAHVQQYDRWGTRAFSERYLHNFGEVEGEAWRVHGRYQSWAQWRGLIAPTDPATMWDRLCSGAFKECAAARHPLFLVHI